MSLSCSSSCRCLISTFSITLRSSGVKCDKSGISVSMLVLPKGEILIAQDECLQISNFWHTTDTAMTMHLTHHNELSCLTTLCNFNSSDKLPTIMNIIKHTVYHFGIKKATKPPATSFICD